jgi:hypothetical protein
LAIKSSSAGSRFGSDMAGALKVGTAVWGPALGASECLPNIYLDDNQESFRRAHRAAERQKREME